MKYLYVAWQSEESREWVPVAMLNEVPEGYALHYTRGAMRCKGFAGFGRMELSEKVYVSKTLFPFFANRMISKSRPEYKKYLTWLGLDEIDGDSMTVMAITGGLRATDSFELVSPPTRSGDELVLNFFARGLRHMPPATIDAIASIQPGTRIFLLRDVQNIRDQDALLLRSDQPNTLLGYVARYYCPGLNRLLDVSAKNVVVTAKRINLDAPLDMRLLCTLRAQCPSGFQLIESENDFLPWSDKRAADAVKSATLNAKTELSLSDPDQA